MRLLLFAYRPGARIARLGGRNKFWGGTRSLFMRIRGGREKFIRVWIKRKRRRPKKKVFFTNRPISTNSGCRLKILAIFHEFLSEDQNKKKKKRSLSQKFYEIRRESTKTTKKQFLLANSRAVNTNLGLDLHSSSPETVNFFGAQSSLGGHGPGMPPPWRRACLLTFSVK